MSWKILFSFSSSQGLFGQYTCKTPRLYICKTATHFITTEKKEQMFLTTRGVTVMEPMRITVYLCAWGTNENKALTGAQFSCSAAFLLRCYAHIPALLITIQSLSVYTIWEAEWATAQGSPWEAAEPQTQPCLPAPPPTLLHRPPLPHTQPSPDRLYFSLSIPLSTPDTKSLWLDLCPLSGHH